MCILLLFLCPMCVASWNRVHRLPSVYNALLVTAPQSPNSAATLTAALLYGPSLCNAFTAPSSVAARKQAVPAGRFLLVPIKLRVFFWACDAGEG